MNFRDIPRWVLVLLAIPIGLVVFGPAISQVTGTAGSVLSESANMLIVSVGFPTALLLFVIAAGLVVSMLCRR